MLTESADLSAALTLLRHHEGFYLHMYTGLMYAKQDQLNEQSSIGKGFIFTN